MLSLPQPYPQRGEIQALRHPQKFVYSRVILRTIGFDLICLHMGWRTRKSALKTRIMGKKTDTIKNAAAKTTAPSPTAAVGKSASTPVKKTAPRTPPATGAKKATSSSRISGDDIALRAYFIAEKRQRLGLPGDTESDWLEAERQLSAELSGTKPKAAKPATAGNGLSANK